MDWKKVAHFARTGLIVFVILTGMVWANTYYRGSYQYKLGEKAFKVGDYKDAIADYSTAVRMYTPFAGYVPASLERMWSIGEGYEKSGQYDWALIAYREVRSSIYAIRSFYTPYEEWIGRSDERIERVLAFQKQKEQAASKTGTSSSVHE